MSEWVIRGYDRDRGRAVSITTLHGVGPDRLRVLLGADPEDPLYDAYPLTAEVLQALVPAGQVEAFAPDVDYFLEYWGDG